MIKTKTFTDADILELPQGTGLPSNKPLRWMNGRDFGPPLHEINGPDGFRWALCRCFDGVFVKVKMGLAR